MRMLWTRTAEQKYGSRLGSVCGSRTEATQKVKISYAHWRSLIHKDKHNAAGNSEKVVRSWSIAMLKPKLSIHDCL